MEKLRLSASPIGNWLRVGGTREGGALRAGLAAPSQEEGLGPGLAPAVAAALPHLAAAARRRLASPAAAPSSARSAPAAAAAAPQRGWCPGGSAAPGTAPPCRGRPPWLRERQSRANLTVFWVRPLPEETRFYWLNPLPVINEWETPLWSGLVRLRRVLRQSLAMANRRREGACLQSLPEAPAQNGKWLLELEAADTSSVGAPAAGRAPF